MAQYFCYCSRLRIWDFLNVPGRELVRTQPSVFALRGSVQTFVSILLTNCWYLGGTLKKSHILHRLQGTKSIVSYASHSLEMVYGLQIFEKQKYLL